jgi:hypothetical protein
MDPEFMWVTDDRNIRFLLAIHYICLIRIMEEDPLWTQVYMASGPAPGILRASDSAP